MNTGTLNSKPDEVGHAPLPVVHSKGKVDEYVLEDELEVKEVKKPLLAELNLEIKVQNNYGAVEAVITPPQIPASLSTSRIKKNCLNNIAGTSLWPTVYLGLSIHDLALSNSALYGTSRFQFLPFGFELYQLNLLWKDKAAISSSVWTAHLGTSLRGSGSDLLYYALPMAIFTAAMGLNAYQVRANRKSLKADIDTVKVKAAILDQKDSFSRFSSSLNPFNPIYRLLDRIDSCYNEPNYLNQVERKAALNFITERMNDKSFLNYTHAIKVFTRIKELKISDITASEKEELKAQINQATESLTGFRKKYAELTCSNTATSILNALASFWQIYACLRLLEIIIIKIQGLINFSMDSAACERQGHIYQYLSHLADYACTLCGDFDNVARTEVFNGQSCLDGLLSQPRNREDIVKDIKRLIPELRSPNINLSNLWKEFKYVELKVTLEALMEIKFLSKLIVSPSPASGMLLLDEKYKELAEFINSKILIGTVDFENFDMHLNAPEFFREIRNASLGSMLLPNTHLDDRAFEEVAHLVPNIKDTINIAHTTPSPLLLKCLVENTIATTLNVADCKLTPEHMDSITLLPKLPTKNLVISGNELTKEMVVSIGQSIENLDSLVMGNVNLKDSFVDILIAFFKKSHLKLLDLRNANLTYENINKIIDNLPPTIKEIVLSGNRMSHIEAENLAKAVIRIGIEVVRASDCDLKSTGAEAIGDVLYRARHTHRLRILELNNNEISCEGGNSIVMSFPGSGVNEISLIGNLLKDEFGLTFARIVPYTNLTTIIFTLNYYTNITCDAMSESIPKSPVTTLDMDVKCDKFVDILSTHPSHYENLANANLDYDDEIEMKAELKPATHLSELSGRSYLSESSTRILQRLQPYTGLTIKNLIAAPLNGIDSFPKISSGNPLGELNQQSTGLQTAMSVIGVAASAIILYKLASAYCPRLNTIRGFFSRGAPREDQDIELGNVNPVARR